VNVRAEPHDTLTLISECSAEPHNTLTLIIECTCRTTWYTNVN